MTRILVPVLLAAAGGGFALGWLAWPSDPADEAGPPAAPAPPALAEAVHRFPLLPADMHSDREMPAIAVDGRGRVLLAWASETAAGERTIFLARSADGGRTFDRPAPFRKAPFYRYQFRSKGGAMTRSTSVAPRLAAAGEAIYLAWTEAVGGGPRVDFLVARTEDGGRTFSAPTRAHGDQAGRPAFTALAAADDGRAACCWLDNRRRVPLPFCSLSGPTGGAFLPEALVYARPKGGVCPCCDTEVLLTGGGAGFAAFRNNDANYRDICVARLRPGGGFEAPVTVNRERWHFEGCPHDGPSLAVAGGRLHVAWMDAHTGRRRVYHAAAGLDDLHFVPHELGAGLPGEQGHPRVAAGAGGALHAAWDSNPRAEPAPAGHAHHASHHPGPAAGGGRTILYARSADGDHFGPARPVDARPGAYQVHPALAVGPSGRVFVVWSELTEAGKSVAFARLAAPAR